MSRHSAFDWNPEAVHDVTERLQRIQPAPRRSVRFKLSGETKLFIAVFILSVVASFFFPRPWFGG